MKKIMTFKNTGLFFGIISLVAAIYLFIYSFSLKCPAPSHDAEGFCRFILAIAVFSGVYFFLSGTIAIVGALLIKTKHDLGSILSIIGLAMIFIPILLYLLLKLSVVIEIILS